MKVRNPRASFAAVHESLVGTFETSRDVRSSVPIRGKADVARTVVRLRILTPFGVQP